MVPVTVVFAAILGLGGDVPEPPVDPAQRQAEAREREGHLNLHQPCPATSMYVLLRLKGRDVSFRELYERFGPEKRGVPATEMIQVARAYGVRLRPVELTAQDLPKIRGPWIAFMQSCSGVYSGIGHYVAARVVDDGSKVQFIDPPRETLVVSPDDLFGEHGWCAIALVPDTAQSRTPWSYVVCGLGAAGVLLLSLLWLRNSDSTHDHRSAVSAGA